MQYYSAIPILGRGAILRTHGEVEVDWDGGCAIVRGGSRGGWVVLVGMPVREPVSTGG